MFIMFFCAYIYAQGDNTACSNAIPTVSTIFDRVKCPGLNTITQYIDKGLDKISEWIYATTALTSINDQCMNPYEGLDLNDPFYCNNQGGFKKLKQYLAFEFMYAGIEGYNGDSKAPSSPIKYRSTFNNQMALFLNKNDYKIPESLIPTKRKEYLTSIHNDMTNNPLLIAYAGEYCEKVVGEFSGELFSMSSAQCISMDNIQKSQNDTSTRLKVESNKKIYFFEPRDKIILDDFGKIIVNNGDKKGTYGRAYGVAFNKLKNQALPTMRSQLLSTKSYKAMQKSCLALNESKVTVAKEQTQAEKKASQNKTTTPAKPSVVPASSEVNTETSTEESLEQTVVREGTQEEIQTPSGQSLDLDETIPSNSPTSTPSTNQNIISLSALLEIIKLLVPAGQNNPPPQIPYYNPYSNPSVYPPMDPAFLPSPYPNPYGYPYGGYPYPSGPSYQPGPSYPVSPGPYSPQQQPQKPMLDVLTGISKLFDAMGQPINVSLQ